MRRAASVNHLQPRRVELQRQRADEILIRAEVGLIDGACDADQIAEMCGGALAVSGEQLGGLLVFPSAVTGDPSRGREMMKGHDRRDLVLVTACEHAAVMVECCDGELAGLGLDPRPFDREAVGVEAEPREHRDVVGVAMVLIAGVARRLDERRPGRVLEHPVVAVEVVALDLVGGSRGAPKEVGGKSETIGGHRTSTSKRNPSDATAKPRSRQPVFEDCARNVILFFRLSRPKAYV